MLDPKKNYYQSRSNDEFLRRMIGGKPERQEVSPSVSPDFLTPVNENTGSPECKIPMPSLAMVYSPVQKWGNILPPAKALGEGTLFADLVKPFCGRSVTRT